MTASLGADTLPLVGVFSPAIIFKRVDFPAPFFPIRAILSFSLMTKDMSLKSVVPLKATVSPSTEIIRFVFNLKDAKVGQQISIINKWGMEVGSGKMEVGSKKVHGSEFKVL